MRSSLTYDENFDLTIGENGWFEMTTDNAEIVVQALRVNLAWQLGEWALNTKRGVDYRGEILVKAPDLRKVRAQFVKAIVTTEGVDRLVSLTLTPDWSLRKLAVRFTVQTSELVIDLWGFVDPTPPSPPEPGETGPAIVNLLFKARPILAPGRPI